MKVTIQSPSIKRTRRLFAMATLTWVTLAMSPSATLLAAGINFYSITDGLFINVYDPTLSGGDFSGQQVSSLSIENIAGVRDAAANLALLGPSGIGFYNVVTGSWVASYNPTLSGGDFGGQSVNSLSIDDIAGVRDLAANLALLGPSGLSFYNVVTGSLVSTYNPTLIGGDFNGQSVNSLSISEIAGVRDSEANLALLGPSGISFYNVVTGALVSAWNPTLVGGDFDGQVVADLWISDIAGIRDAGSNLALFKPVPEPSSFLLAGFGLATFTLYRLWPRRRKILP